MWGPRFLGAHILVVLWLDKTKRESCVAGQHQQHDSPAQDVVPWLDKTKTILSEDETERVEQFLPKWLPFLRDEKIQQFLPKWFVSNATATRSLLTVVASAISARGRGDLSADFLRTLCYLLQGFPRRGVDVRASASPSAESQQERPVEAQIFSLLKDRWDIRAQRAVLKHEEDSPGTAQRHDSSGVGVKSGVVMDTGSPALKRQKITDQDQASGGGGRGGSQVVLGTGSRELLLSCYEGRMCSLDASQCQRSCPCLPMSSLRPDSFSTMSQQSLHEPRYPTVVYDVAPIHGVLLSHHAIIPSSPRCIPSTVSHDHQSLIRSPRRPILLHDVATLHVHIPRSPRSAGRSLLGRGRL